MNQPVKGGFNSHYKNMKSIKPTLAVMALLTASCFTSCKDTNPKTPETDMGMTSDSVFTDNDSIDRNYDTQGADTGLDGK